MKARAESTRRGRAWRRVALLASLVSCSHDWDALDPVGATGTASTGDSGGSGGVSNGGSGGDGGNGGDGGLGTTSTGGSGATGGDGGTGGGPASVSYAPVIAECIDPLDPDPSACRAGGANVRLDVDLEDEAPPMHPNHAYLRFELDDAFAGKIVDSVRLELVVGNASGDSGGGTGELHRVSSFSLPSLAIVAPTSVETLAGDQGPASLNEVVTFSVPSTLAVAGGTIYLGVIATHTDGTHYWNNDGTVPPRLVVDFH